MDGGRRQVPGFVSFEDFCCWNMNLLSFNRFSLTSVTSKTNNLWVKQRLPKIIIRVSRYDHHGNYQDMLVDLSQLELKLLEWTIHQLTKRKWTDLSTFKKIENCLWMDWTRLMSSEYNFFTIDRLFRMWEQ